MIRLFYSIKKTEKGGFVYHEFFSGWSGWSAFSFGDDYVRFTDREQAEWYALERGGANAYF